MIFEKKKMMYNFETELNMFAWWKRRHSKGCILKPWSIAANQNKLSPDMDQDMVMKTSKVTMSVLIIMKEKGSVHFDLERWLGELDLKDR